MVNRTPKDSHAPIRSVIEQRLCHGCGTCASACPTKAIEMVETAAGFLTPQVGDACNGCGLCGKACPGAHLPAELLGELKEGDRRLTAVSSSGVDSVPLGASPLFQRDPFRGPVIGAYLARAADRQLLLDGQSGGAVTALVAYLLSAGRCDGAVVTGPLDAAARPKPIVATTLEELLAAQGSKYCPVALNTALCSDAYQRLERPVIVGLACHVHGIRCLERLRGGKGDSPHLCAAPSGPFRQMGTVPLSRPLVFGLICAGTYSFRMAEHLRRAAGVAEGDFLGLRYRDKAAYGWPGDVSVDGRSRGAVRVPQRVRHLAKAAFRPPRCYLCFDQMNVLSDITFGDPWGIRWDAEGWTVVLTRTPAGQAALDDAVAAGAIKVEPVDPETVFAGQTVDSRHRPQWIEAMAAWREMGYTPPDFGFAESSVDRPGQGGQSHDRSQGGQSHFCGVVTQESGQSPSVPPHKSGQTPARRRRLHRDLAYSVAFFDSVDRPTAIRLAQRRIRRDTVRRALSLPLKALRAVGRRLRGNRS
jgi:coenzyme F420 hydrogenase subunit beta